MRTIVSVLAMGLAAFAAAPIFAADAPGDIAHGKQVFDYWCASCHSPVPREGRPLPGTASLQVKYKGAKPAALEQREDLPAAYVILVIRHGSAGMPSFRKTEVSDQDMRDIAAYLARNTK